MQVNIPVPWIRWELDFSARIAGEPRNCKCCFFPDAVVANPLGLYHATRYPGPVNDDGWKIYLGVSKNNGTPKSSFLIGISIINHPFWGTPIFGNTHFLMGLTKGTPLQCQPLQEIAGLIKGLLTSIVPSKKALIFCYLWY